MASKITYENAKIKVLVKPIAIGKFDWESGKGLAIYSKSGKTCYVFGDDITLDIYRRHGKAWRCFGVPNQLWAIKNLQS